MPSNITRRHYLAGSGSAIIATIAGCSGSSKSNTSNETNTSESPNKSTPTLEDQLATVKEATAKYTDPKQAMKDGFKLGGPYVPGMGWHFLHPGRLETAAKEGLTLEKPPMLTYLDNDDTDGLTLAAVEYGLPVEQADSPNLFNDENADATEKWHTHKAATHVFATENGTQDDPKNIPFSDLITNKNWAEFRPVDTDLTAGDTIALNWGHANAKNGENKTERVVDLVSNHPSLTTLHAWVHVENPAGTFKPVHSKYADGHH